MSERHRLVCRLCGFKAVPATRKDFEDTGVLFRHWFRDKSEELDMEGDHQAEPQVIEPESEGGDFDVWVVTFVRKDEVSPLITHRREIRQ